MFRLALCSYFLFAQIGPVALSSVPEVRFIEQYLAEQTRSKRPLLLGKSLQVNLPPLARVQKINQRVVAEINSVLEPFSEGDNENRVERTLQAVRSFDYQLAEIGAARSFEGVQPIGIISRQIAFFRVWSSQTIDPVDQVMAWLSSFERTAQPGSTFYEYANPQDLASPLKEIGGGERAYLDQPQPSLNQNQALALKRCNFEDAARLESWRCITTLNEIVPLQKKVGSSSQLFSSFGLDTVSEPHFAADNRGFEAVDGQTSLWVIKQAGDLILAYSVTWQHANQPRPDEVARKAADEAYSKEYRRLLLMIDRQIEANQLPWSIVRW